MVRVVLAIGGGDEQRFVHLPEWEGFPAWSRLVAPDEMLRLQALSASSALGELEHPGQVPLADALTLGMLQAMIAEELGPEARIDIVRLGIAGLGALHSERGLGTRIEASCDALLAERLARATTLPVSRWLEVLGALAADARGERRLVLEIDPGRPGVRVIDRDERFSLEA